MTMLFIAYTIFLSIAEEASLRRTSSESIPTSIMPIILILILILILSPGVSLPQRIATYRACT